MLLSWILRTIDPMVAPSIPNIDDAKKLSDYLKKRFCVSTASRIQLLRAKIISCKQTKIMSVKEYYNLLMILYDDLDQLKPPHGCECGKCNCNVAEKNARDKEEEKLHQFLLGLDDELYALMRSNLLDELPPISLERSLQALLEEEHSRGIRKGKADEKNEALISERPDNSRALDKQLIVLQALLTESDPEEDARPFYESRRFVTNFYGLDLRAGGISALSRIVQDGDFRMSTMVAMGSRIYIFGGRIQGDVDPDSPNKRASYFLDLATSSCGKEWIPLLLMISCNCMVIMSYLVTTDKMYIFRGSNSRFSVPCEVFDPQLDQCRRIKSPPGGDGGEEGGKVQIKITPPVLADYKNDRIMVRVNDSMYAYYPSQDRWECVVEAFLGWSSSEHPVTLVDGVIYIHYRIMMGFFEAFDTATKQYLNVQVSPDAVDNYQYYLHLRSYNALLHLGDGILCLLGSIYQDHEPGQPQTSAVHAAQFKVEIVKYNGIWQIPLY